MGRGAGGFYAVRVGWRPGIYRSWPECEKHVKGYSRAVFKKFYSRSQAEEFVYGHYDDRSSGYNNSRGSNKRSWHNRHDDSDDDDEWYEPPPAKRNRRSYDGLERTWDDFVVCHTDGACVHNGRRDARAGYGVYFGPNHPLNKSNRVRGRQTNNTAEIQAIQVAVESAKSWGVKKLEVHTDSEFTINCLTKWMPKWKKNGWLTVEGQPVKNQVDLQNLERAAWDMDIRYCFVRGHNGDHGNEQADALARAGVSM